MRRYIDEKYDEEKVKAIQEMFDMRAFKFTNLACFKQFETQLSLLKKS